VTTGASTRAHRLCLVLVVSAFLVSCSADNRPIVETVRVDRGEVVQTISAPGTVQPADRQPVSATVPGVVSKVRISDGERVEAGEVVVRLASDEVELALEQAEAAEAALDSSQAGVAVDPPGDAAIAASHQSVANLDADVEPDLAKARRRAERIDDPEERAVAETTIALLEEAYQDMRDALLDAGQAAAAEQNAVAASFSSALNQALGQANAGQATQAAGAADTAAARAEDLKLRAPISGVVELDAASTSAPALPEDLTGDAGAAGGAEALAGSLGAAGGTEGGQLRVGVPVSPGQSVFTVFDMSQLYVQADVDEVDAPQLEAGQQVEVLIDAFPDRTFSGEVESVAIEAQVSPTGGVAYPARIVLHGVGPEDGPRVGMTASAEITTRTVTSNLTVPSRSIVRREGGQAVFVVRDGRAAIVPVEVDALGELNAAVHSDELRATDQVIVTGYEDLETGDAVRTE
jgi:HlyD family secretion protein